jgi:hypothetical protein
MNILLDLNHFCFKFVCAMFGQILARSFVPIPSYTQAISRVIMSPVELKMQPTIHFQREHLLFGENQAPSEGKIVAEAAARM